MTTANEQKVIRFLASNVKDLSINEIARKCKLTPNGAYKILKKFELEEIISPKRIANILSYKLDFNKLKTSRIVELAFIPSRLEGRIKQRDDDLQMLKEKTKICILFGSYISSKKEHGDLDILFVLDKKQFNDFKKNLAKIQDIVPIKIHDIIQTKEDLKQNIKKEDMIVLKSIREGIVLWGFEELVKIIKNVR